MSLGEFPGNWKGLLPDDSELDEWQVCVKKAIIYLQKNGLYYNWPKGSDSNRHAGCIADRFHKNVRIMQAGHPPGSYCCGATMEAFMLAWKKYMTGFEDDDISANQMFELYRYFFVFSSDDGKFDQGAKGGLLWLADEVDWLTVKASENPNVFPFGTFLQMQFGPQADDGHSVIVIGQGMKKGRGCLIVWSANYGYRHIIEKVGDSYLVKDGPESPSGHGFDYYFKRRKKNGFQRKFHGAWIVGEE